jgi:hypothetical protein
MPCAEFAELYDLLIEYAELAGEARARVDAHVAQCTGCGEFLEALSAVDEGLGAEIGGRREVSVEFAAAVRTRVRREASVGRPSLIPELLDFTGWAAIVALIGLLAWWVSPLVPVSIAKAALTLNAALAAGFAFLLAAFWIGIRSFAYLKR